MSTVSPQGLEGARKRAEGGPSWVIDSGTLIQKRAADYDARIATSIAVFAVMRSARLTYGLAHYVPHVLAWAMHYEGRLLAPGR